MNHLATHKTSILYFLSLLVSMPHCLAQIVDQSSLFQPFNGQQVKSLLTNIAYPPIDQEVVTVAPIPTLIASGYNGQPVLYQVPANIPFTFVEGETTFPRLTPVVNPNQYTTSSLPEFPGRVIKQAAFDILALTADFFAVGKDGSVGRYTENGSFQLFTQFPGLDARAIAVDTDGRPIVGGRQSTIVRYNRAGTIELTFDAFVPASQANNAAYANAVNALAIDYNNRIIAVGRDNLVIRYNIDGTIDTIYESFPGRMARAIIVDLDNNAYVAGDAGTIVKYNEDGEIETTFDTFPSPIVRSLMLLPPNDTTLEFDFLAAAGDNGIVRIYSLNGTVSEDTPEQFVGVRTQTLTISSEETFTAGGNRSNLRNSSIQQYDLPIRNFYALSRFITVTPRCFDFSANIFFLDAGIKTINGEATPGSIVVVYINGEIDNILTIPASGDWLFDREFTPGEYRVEAVEFFRQGFVRKPLIADNLLSNFLQLFVAENCSDFN